MKQNKKGTSPIFILELTTLDIKEIVCSSITMFSVFKWDNTYKNPYEDKELNEMLNNVQSYVNKMYSEV